MLPAAYLSAIAWCYRGRRRLGDCSERRCCQSALTRSSRLVRAASALLLSSDDSTRGCESSRGALRCLQAHTAQTSLGGEIASVLLPLANPVDASPLTCLTSRQRSA